LSKTLPVNCKFIRCSIPLALPEILIGGPKMEKFCDVILVTSFS